MCRNLHHHLAIAAVQDCGGAVLLLGGIIGLEVVFHYTQVIHYAAAHKALHGEFLVQGGITDAGEVRRGIGEVVTDAVHILVGIVGDDGLLPGSVIGEHCYLAGQKGEPTEGGVTASGAGDEGHIDIAILGAIKGAFRGDHTAELETCAQFLDHLYKFVLQNLTSDGLGAIGLDCRLYGGDKVCKFAHID